MPNTHKTSAVGSDFTAEDVKKLELKIPKLADLTPESVSNLTLDDVKKLELVYSISKGAFTDDERQRLACALFIIHRDGIKDKVTGSILLDEDQQLKADYYLAEALCFTPPDPPASFFLRFLARLTSTRLAIIRCFRLHPLPFLSLATQSGVLFNTFQLSYYAELVFCFSLLLEKSLRPKTSNDEWWWQRIERHRIKEAFSDRELMSILSNAVIWGVVNGVCVFDPGITPLSKALWNLAGFFLDFVHDLYFAHKDLDDHQSLKKSIDDGFHIEGIDLKNKSFQANLTKKIDMLDFKEKRLAIAAALIFAGMCLVFAPALVPWLSAHVSSWMAFYLLRLSPDNINYLKKLGAGIVIFAGVYLAGLGGRLFQGNLTWENFRQMMLFPLLSAGTLTLGALLVSPAVPLIVLASTALVTSVITLLTLSMTGHWAEWFNRKNLDNFGLNFAKTALVPLSVMGTLMLATLGCPISVILATSSMMLGAAFILMKWNWLSFESTPMTQQTSTISLNPQIDSFVTPEVVDVNDHDEKNTHTETGILQINKLCQMSEANRDFLKRTSEANQTNFLEAIKDWSKPEAKRQPSSMSTIKKMLEACSDTITIISPPDSMAEVSRFPSLSPSRTETEASTPHTDDSKAERPQRPRPTPIDVAVVRPLNKKSSHRFNFSFNLFRYCCSDGAKAERIPTIEKLPSVRG